MTLRYTEPSISVRLSLSLLHSPLIPVKLSTHGAVEILSNKLNLITSHTSALRHTFVRLIVRGIRSYSE